MLFLDQIHESNERDKCSIYALQAITHSRGTFWVLSDIRVRSLMETKKEIAVWVDHAIAQDFSTNLKVIKSKVRGCRFQWTIPFFDDSCIFQIFEKRLRIFNWRDWETWVEKKNQKDFW